MPPARFPLEKTAESQEAEQTIRDALAKMHNGAPPFPWIEEDGSALLGCYAPLRCVCHGLCISVLPSRLVTTATIFPTTTTTSEHDFQSLPRLDHATPQPLTTKLPS